MKYIFFLLMSLCSSLFSNSQTISRVTSLNQIPKTGTIEKYFYEAPKGMIMPDSLEALVVFQDGTRSSSKYIPLVNIGGRYKFEFRAKKISSLLLLTIVDANVKLSDYSPAILAKKKVVDNNDGQGFVIHLHDDNGNLFANDAIQLAGLIPDWVYYMDLTEPSNKMLIEMYESAYKKYPEQKNDAGYVDYLNLLYRENKENAKPILLNYAVDKAKKTGQEINLLNAAKVFALLKMDEEKQRTENRVLEMYPFGVLGKERYWQKQYQFNSNAKATEQTLLADMNQYVTNFKDSSKNNFFYSQIISLLFDTSDWEGGLKYEQLISDNTANSYINNKYALKLVDSKMDTPGMSLEIARMLSKRSIDYINAEKKSKTSDWSMADLLGEYYSYLNTYALVFYKQHQYDSAFYYQDIMYKKGNVLNPSGLERYAVYAEKVKGLEYAKQVLELQLLSGVKSPIMLNQLKSIYKQLNLPEDELYNVEKKNKMLSNQKSAAAIKRKLGTIRAKDFKLRNLADEIVSLSKLNNKVVVLDFWATWCAPCKASFPEMQELVNKYKADTGVIFLFIDVWERKEAQKTREIVANYIRDNNYNFNVLFDEKGVVVKDYKIQGIPQKIIIDKKGNVVFLSDDVNYLEDISPEIEAAKK